MRVKERWPTHEIWFTMREVVDLWLDIMCELSTVLLSHMFRFFKWIYSDSQKAQVTCSTLELASTSIHLQVHVQVCSLCTRRRLFGLVRLRRRRHRWRAERPAEQRDAPAGGRGGDGAEVALSRALVTARRLLLPALLRGRLAFELLLQTAARSHSEEQ